MRSRPAATPSASSSRTRAPCPTPRSRPSTDPQGHPMSFQQGLSGLNASSKNLEVIGNNVANANTVGAKSSRAEFGDMYASAIGNTSAGIGVKLQAVTQQFTQGSISTSDNPLDL